MSAGAAVVLVAPGGEERTVQVPAAAFLLDAALAAGARLPRTCLQGWCLACAARVERGPATCADHAAALRYFAHDHAAGFVLPCSARILSPCRLHTGQAGAMRAHRRRLGLPAPGA